MNIFKEKKRTEPQRPSDLLQPLFNFYFIYTMDNRGNIIYILKIYILAHKNGEMVVSFLCTAFLFKNKNSSMDQSLL